LWHTAIRTRNPYAPAPAIAPRTIANKEIRQGRIHTARRDRNDPIITSVLVFAAKIA
jgi:hypothetical protein